MWSLLYAVLVVEPLSDICILDIGLPVLKWSLRIRGLQAVPMQSLSGLYIVPKWSLSGPYEVLKRSLRGSLNSHYIILCVFSR